jgi:hypothetical protein
MALRTTTNQRDAGILDSAAGIDISIITYTVLYTDADVGGSVMQVG